MNLCIHGEAQRTQFVWRRIKFLWRFWKSHWKFIENLSYIEINGNGLLNIGFEHWLKFLHFNLLSGFSRQTSTNVNHQIIIETYMLLSNHSLLVIRMPKSTWQDSKRKWFAYQLDLLFNVSVRHAVIILKSM